jgi:hypothetical protein
MQGHYTNPWLNLHRYFVADSDFKCQLAVDPFFGGVVPHLCPLQLHVMGEAASRSPRVRDGVPVRRIEW